MRWYWRTAIAVAVGYLSAIPFTYLHKDAASNLFNILIRPPAPHPAAIWLMEQTPVFFILVPTALVTIISFVIATHVTWSRSSRETRCRKCGYILRGITEPRCPECGERI